MTLAQPLSAMPGPKGLPFLGVALEMRKELPWLVLERYTRQYGPMARLTIVGKQAIVVADPAVIAKVTSEESNSFYKKRPVQAVKPFNPDDLFVSSGGKDWRDKRTGHPMVTHGSPEMLAAAAERAARHTEAFAARLPESFDASEAFLRLGFDLLSISLFGQALDDDAYAAFQVTTRTVHARMQREATSPFPLGGLRRAEQDQQRQWLALLARAYESCKQPPLCVAAVMKQQGLKGDAAAPAISGTYLGGGISVPVTILNSMFHLSQAPEVWGDCQRRLRAESPALATLGDWLPLESALRESMRVSPAVPLFLRAVREPTELAGYQVPAGAGLMLSIWTMQRDPQHWERAEEFRPQRWDRATVAAHPYRSTWFAPFGWGPRACVGADFALAVIRPALATLVRSGELSVEPGQTYVPELFMGTRLARGLRGKRRADSDRHARRHVSG